MKHFKWQLVFLRLRYLLYINLVFFSILFSVGLINLLLLKNRYPKINFTPSIFGHTVRWPAVRTSPILAFIIFASIITSCIISYFIYFNYIIKKSELEGNKLESGRISISNKIKAILSILAINAFFFFHREIEIGLTRALDGKFDFFTFFTFTIVVSLGILLNFINIKKFSAISRLNPIGKTKELPNVSTKKRSIISFIKDIPFNIKKHSSKGNILKITALIVTMSLMMGASYLINFLSPLNQKFASFGIYSSRIANETILLFSNKGNLLLIMLANGLIFATLCKFVFSAVNRRFEKDKTPANNSVKTIAFFYTKVIFLCLVGNLVISLTNSLEKTSAILTLFVTILLLGFFSSLNCILEIETFVLTGLPLKTLETKEVGELKDIIEDHPEFDTFIMKNLMNNKTERVTTL